MLTTILRAIANEFRKWLEFVVRRGRINADAKKRLEDAAHRNRDRRDDPDAVRDEFVDRFRNGGG